jgi:hypothetical protein
MQERNKLLNIISTYSTILLATAIIGITVLWVKAPQSAQSITESVIHTEYIYVWATPESTTNQIESESTSEITIRIVREYNGKIGIFSENNELIDIINVYTKTLPETDKRLLREGIRVTSKEELNSIIEDYSD